MRKIRIGNDFWQSFQVKENGVIVDLLQIKDTVQVFAKVGDKCFEVPKEMVQIKEDGIITMEVKTELFNIVGRYEVIVKYWHHDISMSDEDRKQAVNFMPFAIVSTSAMADDLEDVPIVGDIIIGLKGDSAFDIWNAKNGNNNTYQDWIDFLQAPATEIEGIVSANEAIRVASENTRKSNEQTRVANEGNRFDAENDREENEDTRSVNEAIRLTNEDDRITNENQRVIDETKRETLYDEVVILKDETEIATQRAIDATNEVNDVVIPNAISATNEAKAQGLYAKNKGDYAKAQGDIASNFKGWNINPYVYSVYDSGYRDSPNYTPITNLQSGHSLSVLETNVGNVGFARVLNNTLEIRGDSVNIYGA